YTQTHECQRAPNRRLVLQNELLGQRTAGLRASLPSYNAPNMTEGNLPYRRSFVVTTCPEANFNEDITCRHPKYTTPLSSTRCSGSM
ncbi:MAG: hypothetical protein ACKPKO_01910, partial [Candidatus Fonsibacter sp.]